MRATGRNYQAEDANHYKLGPMLHAPLSSCSSHDVENAVQKLRELAGPLPAGVGYSNSHPSSVFITRRYVEIRSQGGTLGDFLADEKVRNIIYKRYGRPRR